MGHRLEKRREHDINGTSKVLDQIFGGNQQIVSHEGVSQYHKRHSPGAGRSACGLAALNCARLVFGKEDGGLSGEEIIRWVLSRQGAEEITSICEYWTKASHLDVEDILNIPLFSQSLSLVRFPTYSTQPDLAGFTALLRDMQNASATSSSAVMITKPPEIVACVKIATARGNVFLIFDSHIRSNHPLGAGFILNSSLEDAAKYLVNLFKMENPPSSDAKNPFQWQLDLMRQFCGHILVSKGSSSSDTTALSQTVLESSMTILALTTELASLKSENGFLTVQLEKSNQQLADIQVSANRRSEVPRASDMNQRSRRRHNGKTLINAVPSSSRSTPDTQLDDVDHVLALQLQEEFAEEEQRRYQEEDQRLSAERKALSEAHPTGPALFKCGVCLEEHPEDHVARLSPCLHAFCRDCMREYIRSKLAQHRFPILCPVCPVEKPSSEPAAIDNLVVTQIGITEQEYRVFEELQISVYSVLIHCRRCRESMFVVRQEHQEAKILVCPLPRCQYAWCKTCHQKVNILGPPHSCDGSSELQDLMGKRGWKYCPGCHTPIQKESGCNHMTCMSPGCNTHFCYKCGDRIVTSALGREIRSATSAHYRQCTLFEV